MSWACLILSFQAFAQNQLTVATFNCEFLTRSRVHVKYDLPFNLSDSDKKIQKQWQQSGYREERMQQATDSVAAFLAGLEADVLLLTEVGDESDLRMLQLSLEESGTHYPYMEVGRSRSGSTGQNVAVLSRLVLKDPIHRIPGRKIYREEPDDPETENHTSVSKGMRVTAIWQGIELILYVVHLQSERGGYDKDQRRIAQATIIRRHALPDLRSGAPVIIAGDLNDGRGQPTLSRIRGLDDLEEDLVQTGHSEFFDPNDLDTRWTYTYQGVREQIDHILISFSLVDLCGGRGNIKSRTVDHQKDFVSDHNPFLINLTLPND